MSEHVIPTYPVIRFIVKNGKAIAAVLAIAILAFAVYVFLAGGGIVALAIGIGAAILAVGVVLSYVEVRTISAETLRPREERCD